MMYAKGKVEMSDIIVRCFGHTRVSANMCKLMVHFSTWLSGIDLWFSCTFTVSDIVRIRFEDLMCVDYHNVRERT